MTDKLRDDALQEAHRNSAESSYFEPRPVQDGAVSRKCFGDGFDRGWAAARAVLAEQPAEPVAWRDHVEHRMRTWRQSTMNRSGDRLALDDFMGQDSIDDLIDYVCDEWAAPPAPQPAGRALTRDAVIDLVRECGLDWHRGFSPLFDGDDTNRYEVLVRAALRAHGIKREGE